MAPSGGKGLVGQQLDPKIWDPPHFVLGLHPAACTLLLPASLGVPCDGAPLGLWQHVHAAMGDIYPSLTQCAIVAAALKILLFPA